VKTRTVEAFHLCGCDGGRQLGSAQLAGALNHDVRVDHTLALGGVNNNTPHITLWYPRHFTHRSVEAEEAADVKLVNDGVHVLQNVGLGRPLPAPVIGREGKTIVMTRNVAGGAQIPVCLPRATQSSRFVDDYERNAGQLHFHSSANPRKT
jgi:hypothetical protein